MSEKHTVIPSWRIMEAIVERVPLYTGPTTVRCEAGSESEWICSCRRILTTSNGAMQKREIRPAVPPANITCRLEPSSLRCSPPADMFENQVEGMVRYGIRYVQEGVLLFFLFGVVPFPGGEWNGDRGDLRNSGM